MPRGQGEAVISFRREELLLRFGLFLCLRVLAVISLVLYFLSAWATRLTVKRVLNPKGLPVDKNVRKCILPESLGAEEIVVF